MHMAAHPSDTRTSMVSGAYRSLLVHVEPRVLATPRLETAIRLAGRLNATLIGLCAEMVDPMAFTDPSGVMGGDLATLAQQAVLDDLTRAEALFESKAGGVSSQLLRAEAMPVEAMALVSRAADLIIAGGAPLGRTDKYRIADTAELVLTTGRPVLVTPPHGAKFRGEAAVVAWRDTREARRALSDSLPLLRATETVMVLEVCEDEAGLYDAEARTNAVAEHLGRHGIAATAKATVAPRNETAAEILLRARVLDADLIVAGAYGHSRLGERVFGGVTLELLRKPEHFVLLSH